jgi:hypothetical protein
MTTWFGRALSAIRVAIGVHDPSRPPATPPHGWLLPPMPKDDPQTAPRE